MGTVPDLEESAMVPTALVEKLLTAEEFSRLPDPPDGSHQELVRGVIVVSPPPKGPHGFSCSAVNGAIWSYLQEHPIGQVFGNDTGVVTKTSPDTVRGPDVSYWSFERLPTVPEDDYIRVAPELAVEVLSPSNRPGEVIQKVREYLAIGTNIVWVLSPPDRSVTIYRTVEEGRVLHSGSTLTAEDVLPGFSIPVAKLFRAAPSP
jgi:Uma2 family endonuclease